VTASRADLRGIAAANNSLRDDVRPPIKLGHSREQRLLRASGIALDEQPAAGWLAGFRVEGGKLLADLKAVPKKLCREPQLPPKRGLDHLVGSHERRCARYDGQRHYWLGLYSSSGL
jgi:hypothetical protein